ncbi:MAG: hypothetical protein M3548_05850 [Actinomycetota bacterium]|nr:hypothetical protein [Actinomycetota bacterium]
MPDAVGEITDAGQAAEQITADAARSTVTRARDSHARGEGALPKQYARRSESTP